MNLPSQSASPRITSCLSSLQTTTLRSTSQRLHFRQQQSDAKVMLITMASPAAAVKSLTAVDNIPGSESLQKILKGLLEAPGGGGEGSGGSGGIKQPQIIPVFDSNVTDVKLARRCDSGDMLMLNSGKCHCFSLKREKKKTHGEKILMKMTFRF